MRATRTLRHILTFAALTLAVTQAYAQNDPRSTTAGFKAACEAAGNRVVLNQSLTVNTGYTAGYPEQVTTGCRVELTNGAELVFDRVGLQFAGPLTIVGGSKSGVAMQESSLAGTTVNVSLTGDEGFIRTSFSRIDATTGNMTVALGTGAKMELFRYRYGIASRTNSTFYAAGALSITAGSKLSGSMNEVGLTAGGNISVRGNGAESELKYENSGSWSQTGSVSFVMAGARSKAEMSNSSFRGAGNVDVAMGQSESGLSLSNTTVTSGATAQVYVAGSKSELSLSNGSIVATGAVLISAAAGGTEGSLKAENVGISAGTPVRMVTGALGKTTAVQNRITGTGLVQIISDPSSGSCEAILNRITAPQQQICN
jgi:hypothetical protein